MSGYHTILRCEKLKERADKLGFMLCYSKYRDSTSIDQVAIKPKDKDVLPIYTRDAEFYCGTINEMEAFFAGLEWARNYDRMLKVSDDKKRERKEQDERNRQLARILKDEKVLEIKT